MQYAREVRAVMSQGAGQGFHVHTVLQGQRCECVPHIMESDVFANETRFIGLQAGSIP